MPTTLAASEAESAWYSPVPHAGNTPPGAGSTRAETCCASRSWSTAPAAPKGVTGKKRMPSKFIRARPFGCRRARVRCASRGAGVQPSRRRALAFENAGDVPVSSVAARAVPGWKRGSSSASGSRASASSAPDEEHLAVRDVAERGEQGVGEGRDIARIDVVEQGRRRQCRVIQPLANGVTLLGRCSDPLLGRDDVAGAERGEPHGVAGLALQHRDRLLDQQFRERVGVPGLRGRVFVERKTLGRPAASARRSRAPSGSTPRRSSGCRRRPLRRAPRSRGRSSFA